MPGERPSLRSAGRPTSTSARHDDEPRRPRRAAALAVTGTWVKYAGSDDSDSDSGSSSGEVDNGDSDAESGSIEGSSGSENEDEDEDEDDEDEDAVPVTRASRSKSAEPGMRKRKRTPSPSASASSSSTDFAEESADDTLVIVPKPPATPAAVAVAVPRPRGRPPGSTNKAREAAAMWARGEPPRTRPRTSARAAQCSARGCPAPDLNERDMVVCAACGNSFHGGCVQLAPGVLEAVRAAAMWQCPACKACAVCKQPAPVSVKDAEPPLRCRDCDCVVHVACAQPASDMSPPELWSCESTTHTCGERQRMPATPALRHQPKPSGQFYFPPPRHSNEQSHGSNTIKRRGRPPSATPKTPSSHARKTLLRRFSPPPPVKQTNPLDIHESDRVVAVQTFVVPPDDEVLFQDAVTRTAEVSSTLKAEQSNGKIPCVQLGNWDLYPWHASPYPQDFAALAKIYLCGFCLQYFKTAEQLCRHCSKSVDVHVPHPPGDEIYRKGKLSIWEIDGRKNKIYAQNLCLLAKMFIDHKTLYYDVEPFLFYVLTEWTESGAELIGYFSKEKESFLNYNLSCILTLPHQMRKGYGRMLIDFSYLLSRKEGKTGSPEKPLSDLGLLSYRRYWTEVLLELLQDTHPAPVSIQTLSEQTAMTPADIVSTLQSLGLIKYWRARHVVTNDPALYARFVVKRRGSIADDPTALDPSALRWIPFLDTFVREK